MGQPHAYWHGGVHDVLRGHQGRLQATRQDRISCCGPPQRRMPSWHLADKLSYIKIDHVHPTLRQIYSVSFASPGPAGRYCHLRVASTDDGSESLLCGGSASYNASRGLLTPIRITPNS